MRPFRITWPDGAITHEQYKAMVLQLDPDKDDAEQKLRMELEKQFAAELERALREQMNDLIPPTASDDTVRSSPAHVTATSGPVRDALVKGLGRGASIGVGVAFDQLQTIGMGFAWDLAHTRASQWASAYSFDLVRGINSTTQAQLQTAVDEWFRNPDSLGALRKQLTPTFGARRAQLISQTETTRAAFEGSTLGYEESKVVAEVEWVTVNDERVCTICGPLDGKRADLRGNFEGGVGVPAHPGCRCFVRPVVEN
jgi:SPP1 gp7 family putative phage head morphogenesis protein